MTWVPLTVASAMKATVARDTSWLKESGVIAFGGGDQRVPEVRAGSNARNARNVLLFRLFLSAGYRIRQDIPK